MAGVVTLISASPSSARCLPANIAFEPDEAARGELVSVTGDHFGDSCFDVGDPPEGQGVLGNPEHDLELFVRQGGRDLLVAEGDAGTGYGFTVDVVVPLELEPGDVTFVARRSDGREVEALDDQGIPLVLTVADGPPAGDAATVAAFDPIDTPLADDAADDEGGGTSVLPLVGVALVVAAIAACVLYPRRKLRPRPPTS